MCIVQRSYTSRLWHVYMYMYQFIEFYSCNEKHNNWREEKLDALLWWKSLEHAYNWVHLICGGKTTGSRSPTRLRLNYIWPQFYFIAGAIKREFALWIYEKAKICLPFFFMGNTVYILFVTKHKQRPIYSISEKKVLSILLLLGIYKLFL